MSRDRALQNLCVFVFSGVALNTGAFSFAKAAVDTHGWDRFDMYAMAVLCFLAYAFIAWLFVFKGGGDD